MTGVLEDKIEYSIISEFAPKSQSTYYNMFYTVGATLPTTPRVTRQEPTLPTTPRGGSRL